MKKNKINHRKQATINSASTNSDLQVLHTTCDDVLRTMSLLSNTTPRFDACSDLGNNLHELGITLGSLDRVLRHFICDVLLAGTDLDPRLALDSSLTNALKLSQKTPVVKRTSLLRGGVASHLFLFSLVLRRARAAIRGAAALERQNYRTTRFAYGTVSGLAALQLGRIILHRRPRARSAWYSAVLAGTLTWWWMTWYQAQRHIDGLRRSNSRLMYLLRMWTIVVNVVHQAQLRRATSYVQLTNLLSPPSTSTMTTATTTPSSPTPLSTSPSRNVKGNHQLRRPSKGHAAKSFLSLVSIPHDEDVFISKTSNSSTSTSTTSSFSSLSASSSSTTTSTSSELSSEPIKTYRGLMHVAPPPTTFAFWYDDLLADGNVVSRWGIKHGLNVLYASCGVSLTWVGRDWYATVGRMVQACVMPYYALQPTLAASRAHSFLCNADATDIQIAWSPMMHEAAIPIALSIHSRGTLAVAERKTMEYDGERTESYVFSVGIFSHLHVDHLRSLYRNK